MENSDPTIDKYIAKCKPLASKFDIIGIEGHYGDVVFNKSLIDSKVARLVTGLNKKVWFTEVDWSFNISQSPAKLEEFMRSCFANKDVEGIVIWTWCKRKMWRELSTYFVDSLLVETPTGKKWRDVRKEWRTDTSGTADANGNFSFTGYQGKYRIVANNDTQYVYLYPKDSLVYLPKSGSSPVQHPSVQTTTHLSIVKLNGATINLPVGLTEHKPLYFSTYSISGKLIAKFPLIFSNGIATVNTFPSGCQVYRISSSDKTYYSGMGLQVH
jgi:hypothetical protein